MEISIFHNIFLIVNPCYFPILLMVITILRKIYLDMLVSM